MKSLFEQLWNDDAGAIVSTELILIIGVVLFGIIPGLVAMRNSINAAFGTIGNVLTRIVPSFTFSGWEFSGSGGTVIAVVQGFEVDPVTGMPLVAAELPPLTGAGIVIPPAP